MVFRVLPLRFVFKVRESIEFPTGQAGNIFRGAIGTVADRSSRLYKELFDPKLPDSERTGYRSPPRPFVLRIRNIDGRIFQSGEQFEIGINLFRADAEAEHFIRAAIRELSRTGIGPRRSAVELAGESTNGGLSCPLYEQPRSSETMRVRVLFQTPTELKGDGEIAERPEFYTLAARLRERISSLSELYGDGPFSIDSRAYSERARTIRMTHCAVTWFKAERRSTRTGQVHPLGGLLGSAEYQGELDEFLPYLEIGKWTGVGRQTTWGKGEIAMEIYSG